MAQAHATCCFLSLGMYSVHVQGLEMHVDISYAPEMELMLRCTRISILSFQQVVGQSASDSLWETVAGTRTAAHELAEVGVPHRLAWQVVEKHGANAMAALVEDPYSTLRPFRGYSFRSVIVAVMT